MNVLLCVLTFIFLILCHWSMYIPSSIILPFWQHHLDNQYEKSFRDIFNDSTQKEDQCLEPAIAKDQCNNKECHSDEKSYATDNFNKIPNTCWTSWWRSFLFWLSSVFAWGWPPLLWWLVALIWVVLRVLVYPWLRLVVAF